MTVYNFFDNPLMLNIKLTPGDASHFDSVSVSGSTKKMRLLTALAPQHKFKLHIFIKLSGDPQ
jgi:hypothetical protein